MAIGDGANDVSMIMEAHIGVGIRGKEGTQAVRSADYAIGQFKFLKNLTLCHGRWGYRRVGLFICYYFYKNVILVFCEMYFAFVNGYSGQIFFADWLPMLYNAVWTSWPCIFTYIFERVSHHLRESVLTVLSFVTYRTLDTKPHSNSRHCTWQDKRSSTLTLKFSGCGWPTRYGTDGLSTSFQCS